MSSLVKDLAKRGVTLEARLGFKSNTPLDSETAELLQSQKGKLLLELVESNAVPRLPWHLERLVSAACSSALPEGSVTLPRGIVPDLNRYVTAWASSYLNDGGEDALSRLWEVYKVWQG